MLAFTDDPLDRAAARRTDRAFLAAALEDPGSRAVLVGREGPLLDARGRAALVPVAAALAGGAGPEPLFLGLQGEHAIFALDVPAGLAEGVAPAHARFASLRDAAATMPAPDAGLLAHAVALAGWHRAQKGCARCGSPSVSEEGGHVRRCIAHGHEHHPRTDPVVIMLVTAGDKVLMGRQKHFLPGMYSCLAGFVEAAETIEDAVRREIFEESGIRCTDVNYYMTQPWPYPSSLMIGCTARALNEDIVVDRTELEDARWFDRTEATLMIRREHPDGLAGPHPFAIAHHLLGRWIQDDPDRL